MNKIKYELVNFFKFRTVVGLFLSLVIGFTIMIVNFEVNDGIFFMNWFSNVYYVAYNFGLYVSLVLAIVGFVTRSKSNFVLIILIISPSFIFYPTKILMTVLIITCSAIAYSHQKKLSKRYKEYESIQIVARYVENKYHTTEIDQQYIKYLSSKDEFDK